MINISEKYYNKCVKWVIDVIKKYRMTDEDIVSIDDEGNLYVYNPEIVPEYYTMHPIYTKWKKDNKKLTIADEEEIKAVNRFYEKFKNHGLKPIEFIELGKNLTGKNVTNIILREDYVRITLEDKVDKKNPDKVIGTYDFDLNFYEVDKPKYDLTTLECDNYVEYQDMKVNDILEKRLQLTDDLFIDVRKAHFMAFDAFNLDTVYILEETEDTALLILESNIDEDSIDKSKAGNTYFDNVCCFYRVAKCRA